MIDWSKLPPMALRSSVIEFLTRREEKTDNSPPNASLVFDRYLPIWGTKSPGSSDRLQERVNAAIPTLKPHLEMISEIHARLDRLLQSTSRSGGSARSARWKTSSRLTFGLGAFHPLAPGISIDFTSGVPVILGSSLKGLCRAYGRLVGLNTETLVGLFGNEMGGDEARVGALVFLPAYPRITDSRWGLEADIVNVHLPGYYRDTKVGDERMEALPIDDPIPVKFLTVPRGTVYEFRVLSRPGAGPQSAQDGLEILGSALALMGIGAKTAVGYGRFEVKKEAQVRPLLRIAYLNADQEAEGDRVERALLGDVATLAPENPDRPEIRAFKLAPAPFLKRIPPHSPLEPVDWPGLQQRVSRLATTLTEDQIGVRPVRNVLHGKAPLQAFFLFGHSWGAHRADFEVLNARESGFDLVAAQSGGDAGADYFDRVTKLPEPADMSVGMVAIYLAADRGEPDWESLARVAAEPIIGRIVVTSDVILERRHGPGAARQLRDMMSRIPSRFPKQTGLIIAIKGPATLAFLAGRAVNARLFRRILVPYFDRGQYGPGLALDH